jgi:signal transduction histidine kinase
VTQVVPAVSAYTVVSALSGVVTGLLAVSVYRGSTGQSSKRRYADLVRPFILVLVLFTAAAFGFAVAAINGPPESAFAGLTLFLISLPWIVFALRQAGRGYLLSRWRVGALLATELPILIVLSLASVPGVTVSTLPESFGLAASFLSLIPLGVVFVAAGLLLLATYRHGSTSLVGGVLVVLLVIILLFPAQLTRPDLPVFSATVVSLSYAAFAGTAVAAVTRYDVLSVRPGTGTLGERKVVTDMSEPVLVVGPQGTIGRSNETARDLFGADIDGSQFADVFGCPVTDLASEETIERWTDRGRVRFDPRVSRLTGGGQTIGYAVTLIDVTDRELRKQRIQVLNRILRHNIRNDLDVVRARAEAVTTDDLSTDEQVETILDVADGLEEMSADARRIQKLIQRPQGDICVDLAALVDTVVEAVDENTEKDPAVSVDVPSLTLQLDEELLQFALRNLVENAVQHSGADPSIAVRATTTETGLRLVVADDGPGIPESERAVIETEQESPLAHATTVGLWGTNWAVQSLGGELSFEESDLGGAAVCIDIPGSAVESE